MKQMHLDYKAIGERVKSQRAALKLTQSMLGDKVGVSASFIGHIERAEKVASIATLAELSTALDVSLDWLVFGIKTTCKGDKCPLYCDIKEILTKYGGRYTTSPDLSGGHSL